jgi:hypothetical protein
LTPNCIDVEPSQGYDENNRPKDDSSCRSRRGEEASKRSVSLRILPVSQFPPPFACDARSETRTAVVASSGSVGGTDTGSTSGKSDSMASNSYPGEVDFLGDLKLCENVSDNMYCSIRDGVSVASVPLNLSSDSGQVGSPNHLPEAERTEEFIESDQEAQSPWSSTVGDKSTETKEEVPRPEAGASDLQTMSAADRSDLEHTISHDTKPHLLSVAHQQDQQVSDPLSKQVLTSAKAADDRVPDISTACTAFGVDRDSSHTGELIAEAETNAYGCDLLCSAECGIPSIESMSVGIVEGQEAALPAEVVAEYGPSSCSSGRIIIDGCGESGTVPAVVPMQNENKSGAPSVTEDLENERELAQLRLMTPDDIRPREFSKVAGCELRHQSGAEGSDAEPSQSTESASSHHSMEAPVLKRIN